MPEQRRMLGGHGGLTECDWLPCLGDLSNADARHIHCVPEFHSDYPRAKLAGLLAPPPDWEFLPSGVKALRMWHEDNSRMEEVSKIQKRRQLHN